MRSSRASITGSSVVPGLPKIYATPSPFQDFEKDLGSTSGIGALEGGGWLVGKDAPFLLTLRPVVWAASVYLGCWLSY